MVTKNTKWNPCIATSRGSFVHITRCGGKLARCCLEVGMAKKNILIVTDSQSAISMMASLRTKCLAEVEMHRVMEMQAAVAKRVVVQRAKSQAEVALNERADQLAAEGRERQEKLGGEKASITHEQLKKRAKKVMRERRHERMMAQMPNS